MVIARRSIELIVDTIGEILAFFAAFLILLMCLNGVTKFIPEDIRNILGVVREVIIVGLVLAKGMEFCLKKGWVLTIVFGAVCLAIIVLMFFPESMPSWIPPELITG